MVYFWLDLDSVVQSECEGTGKPVFSLRGSMQLMRVLSHASSSITGGRQAGQGQSPKRSSGQQRKGGVSGPTGYPVGEEHRGPTSLQMPAAPQVHHSNCQNQPRWWQFGSSRPILAQTKYSAPGSSLLSQPASNHQQTCLPHLQGPTKSSFSALPCIRPPPHAPCLPLGSSSQGPQMPGALSDVPTFPDLVSYPGQAQLTSHPAVLGPLSLSLTLSLPPGARSSFSPSGFNSSATSSERRTWHRSQRPRQSDCSLFTCLEHLTTGRAYLSAAYAVSSVRMQS